MNNVHTEYNKMVKINNGKAVHIAKSFINPNNVNVTLTQCGSGEGKKGVRFYTLPVETDLQYVTCKKCAKYLKNLQGGE
jgi:hypothetical protein